MTDQHLIQAIVDNPELAKEYDSEVLIDLFIREIKDLQESVRKLANAVHEEAL
jgi:hypothetical protein